MKKIIKSSVLLLAVCFIAGKVNAQLASEKPAMTAEQMSNLIKARSAAKSAPAATVPVASQSPAQAIPVRAAVVSTDKATATTASGTVVPKLPAISDQGGVKPVTAETPEAKPASAEPTPAKVIIEPKLPQVPMQDQKAKSKD